MVSAFAIPVTQGVARRFLDCAVTSLGFAGIARRGAGRSPS
jgi:hypothetical protein